MRWTVESALRQINQSVQKPDYYLTHRQMNQENDEIVRLMVRKLNPETRQFFEWHWLQRKQTIIEMIKKGYGFSTFLGMEHGRPIGKMVSVISGKYLRTDQWCHQEDDLISLPLHSF